MMMVVLNKEENGKRPQWDNLLRSLFFEEGKCMAHQLTKEDIAKMEEEIEYRKLVVRKELLEAVKDARAQGDLSENFEYYAAKREKNPCKRTFQAIRIEVNGELDHLKNALDDIFSKMGSGARLAIITFHSLEDRIVKQKYKEYMRIIVIAYDSEQHFYNACGFEKSNQSSPMFITTLWT